MRITRRPSGGRGEYEISEATPAGVSPSQLLDREIFLRLSTDWSIDTGATLRKQGGKLRIRLNEPIHGMHPHRQLAAALLLPETVREERAFGAGEPVIQSGRYAIEHIQVRDADVSRPGKAILDVGNIVARNAMVLAHEIRLDERLAQLQEAWDRAPDFPNEIADLLREHRLIVRAGTPVPEFAARIVGALQAQLSDDSRDLKIEFTQQEDPLPALLESLRIEVPTPPVAPDDVAPEELPLRRRTVKEWKRWANARGPKSARFRQRVREAYQSTCVLCGVQFPPAAECSAGVDAAHILPWCDYDLDEVRNGLCLCKQHHWAFDEGIFQIVAEGSQYIAQLAPGMAQRLIHDAPGYTLEPISRLMGPIPEERLPQKLSDWPQPSFLTRLNEAQEPIQ